MSMAKAAVAKAGEPRSVGASGLLRKARGIAPEVETDADFAATGEARIYGIDISRVPLYPPARLGGWPGVATGRLATTRGALQAKLEVGSVDDPLEQEADQVAERVLRMPDPTAANSAAEEPPGSPLTPTGARLSRKCAACKEDDEEKGVRVQRRAAPEASAGVAEAPPIVEHALSSGGRALDEETRRYFESRMRFDLSKVRIHTDARAAESARAVNALAYTVGHDVVFGQGRYAPAERDGKRLLAHELAHVVQQSTVGPAPMSGTAGGRAGAPTVSSSPAHVARETAPTSFKVDGVHAQMLDALAALMRHNDEQHRKAVLDVFSVGKDQAINTILRLNTYTDNFTKFFWGSSVADDVRKDVIKILTDAAGPEGPVPTPPPDKKQGAAPPVNAPGKQPTGASGQPAPAAAKPAEAVDAASESALADAITQAIPQGRFAFVFTELDMRDMGPMLRVLDRLGAGEIGTLEENLHAPHSDGRFVERLRCALATVKIGKGSSGDVTAVTAGIELIAQPAQTLAILAYVESHATSEGAKTLLSVLEPKTPEPAQGGGSSGTGILSAFKAAVRAKALATLDGNVAAVGDEEAKYADTRDGSPVWEKLRAIAGPMLSRDRRLKQAAEAYDEQAAKAEAALREIDAKAKRREGEAGAEGASADSPVDHANTAVTEQKEFASSQEGAKVEAPAESGDALADLRAYAALWKKKAESARTASRELHKAYPILAAGDLLVDEGKEGAEGASAKGPDTNDELFQKIRVQTFDAIRDAVARTKERLANDDIPLAQLEPIVRAVEQDMHLDEPEHAAEKKVVDAWINETRSKEANVQLAFMGATLVLGIAALVTGGAAAVVLGLIGSGAGVVGAAINLDHAAAAKDAAVAGDIGDPLLDDPDEAKAAFNMAVIDAVLSGLDFAIAVHQAAEVAKAARAKRAAERAARGADEAAKDAKSAKRAAPAEEHPAKPTEEHAAKPTEEQAPKREAASGGKAQPEGELPGPVVKSRQVSIGGEIHDLKVVKRGDVFELWVCSRCRPFQQAIEEALALPGANQTTLARLQGEVADLERDLSAGTVTRERLDRELERIKGELASMNIKVPEVPQGSNLTKEFYDNAYAKVTAVEEAPPFTMENGTVTREGHAKSHNFSKKRQVALLNDWEIMFTGFNEHGRPVDVYYKNGECVITVHQHKTQVITAYDGVTPERWATGKKPDEVFHRIDRNPQR